MTFCSVVLLTRGWSTNVCISRISNGGRGYTFFEVSRREKKKKTDPNTGSISDATSKGLTNAGPSTTHQQKANSGPLLCLRMRRVVVGFKWSLWVHILKHTEFPLPPFPNATQESSRVFTGVFFPFKMQTPCKTITTIFWGHIFFLYISSSLHHHLPKSQ